MAVNPDPEKLCEVRLRLGFGNFHELIVNQTLTGRLGSGKEVTFKTSGEAVVDAEGDSEMFLVVADDPKRRAYRLSAFEWIEFPAPKPANV